MNREQVKEIFKILNNVYPQFDATKEKIDVWHKLLKDQKPEAVLKNTNRYVLENRFPPTVADIRERYREDTSTNILAQIWEWEENASRKQ